MTSTNVAEIVKGKMKGDGKLIGKLATFLEIESSVRRRKRGKEEGRYEEEARQRV